MEPTEEPVSFSTVSKSVKEIKAKKAASSSEIVAEMLEASVYVSHMLVIRLIK